MTKIPALAVLFLSFPATHLPAQAPAGVTATLRAERELVPAGQPVKLTLTLTASQAATVPAELINGVQLDTLIDDKKGPEVRDAGKGGAVELGAGTKIERSLAVEQARLLPAVGSAVVTIAISWPGLPGANCVIRVAPDTSKLDLDKLDLEKTRVVLVTNHGEMTLAFLPGKAPQHVRNFLELCKKGFYDGTKFHRVIRGFMIQGGDPNTKDKDPATWGQGSPGYTVNAEFNDTRHVRGVLSMARSADPNSAGSQFFICHKDAPHLDNQYTAFGNLEKGADVLDSIANSRVAGPGNTPVEPVILHSAIILPAMK